MTSNLIWLPSEEHCYEVPLLLTTIQHPFSGEGEPKQSACSTSGPLIPPLGKGGGKEPSEERGGKKKAHRF